ncbi:MAG TPA: NADPH:quinone oxidoreductase family protein [Candidatus Binataceae bacterium]|nr:NADPH:quinone oxidoreductase family protein [Candidatus Binataceae bacterium]
MKAVVLHEFGPVGSARVEERERPEPGPHEVCIDVNAVAANFVDILVMEGRYQFLPKPPFIPGKGPTGIVAACGPKVTRFKPGERVLAMCEQGGYAEAACAEEDQCYALPDAMSFQDAAALSLAADTAWVALMERGRLKTGECVLVTGATGAVGNAAVQIAKAKGATVLAAVSSPAKADAVLRAGADHAVDLSQPNLREALREQVFAATQGRGADIVIDALGGDIFDAAVRALAWRGRLVVIGFAAGRIATLKTNYLLLKNIETSGLQISDYRKRIPGLMRECFADVFSLYTAGNIRPAPCTLYPLRDYARALIDLGERRVAGRAVLIP